MPEAFLQRRLPGKSQLTSSTTTLQIWTRRPMESWKTSRAPRSAENWSEFLSQWWMMLYFLKKILLFPILVPPTLHENNHSPVSPFGQHPDLWQHVWADRIQGWPADQAGPLHPGESRASGHRPAEAEQQALCPHERGPGADGDVQPGAPDHDGAERWRRQDEALCLHTQAEETPAQGHTRDQKVRGVH